MAGDELSIGKAADCNMVIADDDYVSRRHARLVKSDGMVFLEDLGSSNGTFLRVRRPIVLEPGDEIVVGTCSLRFDEKAQPSSR
jgi:pSer/pThr/pTyr-binding forkhead associated (FHA) protein